MKWQTPSLRWFLSFHTWNDTGEHKQCLCEPPPVFEVSNEHRSQTTAGQDECLMWDWWWRGLCPSLTHTIGRTTQTETEQRDLKYGYCDSGNEDFEGYSSQKLPKSAWSVGCCSSLIKDLTCGLSTLTKRHVLSNYPFPSTTTCLT